MAAASSYFSADYAEARGKFRDAAAKAGARLASQVNAQVKGPAGEDLATDIAWVGPADASRVLMTISATHGVEGFCGSGVQVGSFAEGFARELPRDTALLAVHAINPYGFAWIRRVNESNIDLNRNFVDFSKPLPRNEGYDELADAICPDDWSEPLLAAAKARLDDYAEKRGLPWLQQAISGGQYTHPNGIFFGGAAASWSRRTLLWIAEEYLRKAQHVAIIDYHTGLGPYGHGERIILHRRDNPALARAQHWYGEAARAIALGNSASADVVGDGLTGLDQMLTRAGKQVTGMALEYGVRPLHETIDALRADNWVHLHGRLDDAKGREIKAGIRDVFYGDKDDWKGMVFEQAMDAQRRALRGLAE